MRRAVLEVSHWAVVRPESSGARGVKRRETPFIEERAFDHTHTSPNHLEQCPVMAGACDEDIAPEIASRLPLQPSQKVVSPQTELADVGLFPQKNSPPFAGNQMDESQRGNSTTYPKHLSDSDGNALTRELRRTDY